MSNSFSLILFPDNFACISNNAQRFQMGVHVQFAFNVNNKCVSLWMFHVYFTRIDSTKRKKKHQPKIIRKSESL